MGISQKTKIVSTGVTLLVIPWITNQLANEEVELGLYILFTVGICYSLSSLVMYLFLRGPNAGNPYMLSWSHALLSMGLLESSNFILGLPELNGISFALSLALIMSGLILSANNLKLCYIETIKKIFVTSSVSAILISAAMYLIYVYKF